MKSLVKKLDALLAMVERAILRKMARDECARKCGER